MSSPVCLFCPGDLLVDTKPEHILLDAFGGRMTTRTAICSACNEHFGGTIDSAFAGQVIEFRNLMQLRSGSGDPPPKVPKATIGGQKVNIAENGGLQGAGPPFTVEQRPDGTWNLEIRARSAKHLQALMPHIAAKLRTTTDELRRQLTVSGTMAQITNRPGKYDLHIGLGGPDALRSMVKAGLVLWSTLTGNDEVRSEPFAAARSFVLHDDRAFNLDRCSLDTRDLPIAAAIKARYGALFNLLYLCSDGQGRVIGHFTLFNCLSWQFVLATSGGLPERQIALAANPEQPRDWSAAVAAEFNLAMDWLATPDRSCIEPARKRWIEINQHYHRTAGPRVLGDLCDEVAAAAGYKPDQQLTDQDRQTLWNRLHDPIKHFLLGTSYRQELTVEQIAAMMKGDPPFGGI